MPTTKEIESVPIFDTREYVRTLTRGGSFSEGQANASADGLQKALAGVATKADVELLRAEMGVLGAELKADIKVLEARINLLEKKMDVHFQALQEQMRALQKMMIVGFSVIATSVLVSTLLLGLG